jgi:hypothetical protein
MKKLIAALSLLALVLLVAASALGQSVGASQIRRKADGGLVADAANALTVGITRSGTAPTSPVSGQLWLDTSAAPAILKTWNGSTWEIPPNGSALTQATMASLPGSPSDGQIVWISSLRRAVVWDATAARWYYLDASGREAQADYSLEGAGYSSSFLAAPGATTGSVSAGGSVTVGTHVCATTFYNSTGGETTPGTETSVLTTTGGQQTLALAIPTGGTGTRGRRVWCSKANTASPLLLIGTVDDNTTTSFNVTIADGSYGTASAPDVDYSAPIPAGWSVFLDDATLGGCGSTGSSLLCAAHVFDTIAAGSAGPRLFYGVVGSPPNWSVSFKVARFDRGFTGNAAATGDGYQQPPVVVLSNSNVVAAASMWAGAFYGYTSGSAIPPNPVKPLGIGYHRRLSGAAWTNTPSNQTGPWPLLSGVPFYVHVGAGTDGGNFLYSPQISQDGRRWKPFMYTTFSSSATPCSNSLCATDEMSFVGIALERVYNTTFPSGTVFEIKEFLYQTE